MREMMNNRRMQYCKHKDLWNCAYFGFETETAFGSEMVRSMESSDGKCDFVTIIESPL